MDESTKSVLPEKLESPVQGLAYREALSLGFERASDPHFRLSIASPLVTWIPALLLSMYSGYAVGHGVTIPFLLDPAVYGRYLIGLPLLILSDHLTTTSRSVQTGYFLESGLISQSDRSEFTTLTSRLRRYYDSRIAHLIMLPLSYLIVIVLRTLVAYSAGTSNWERVTRDNQVVITPAGWWCILFCLPMLMYWFLRSLWKAAIWNWFLFRVSRHRLILTATHPDRSGGLGFLAWGQASFALTLAAVSSVLSGSFASEIIYQGESFNGLKYHLVVYLCLVILIFHVPLVVFSRQLALCRFQALLDFGLLVWRHDRAFHEKWVDTAPTAAPSLLGNPDVSSLADIGTAYDHVSQMRVLPFDRQAFLVILAAAAAPMIPFVFSTIPMSEILQRLALFLV